MAHCYEPRPDDVVELAPDGTITPEATPEPVEGERAFLYRPAEERSVFRSCQIIAYYGFPGEPRMGIAGEHEPEEVLRLLREQIAEYEAVGGFRTVVPALELIYAVAQADQTADGTYLARMPAAMVERYIALADEMDFLLIFDIQMGSSTVEAEIAHLLPYLKHPRVHLALDPEFVTTPDTPPGLRIGGLEASEINRAQHILRDLVEEHDLPNKILMVHQFIPEMILNKEQIENVPRVDLVIHQDGFGGAENKIANYNRYVRADGAEHGGFKIFYKQDNPVMTPEEVNSLVPKPDIVTYQ